MNCDAWYVSMCVCTRVSWRIYRAKLYHSRFIVQWRALRMCWEPERRGMDDRWTQKAHSGAIDPDSWVMLLINGKYPNHHGHTFFIDWLHVWLWAGISELRALSRIIASRRSQQTSWCMNLRQRSRAINFRCKLTRNMTGAFWNQPRLSIRFMFKWWRTQSSSCAPTPNILCPSTQHPRVEIKKRNTAKICKTSLCKLSALKQYSSLPLLCASLTLPRTLSVASVGWDFVHWLQFEVWMRLIPPRISSLIVKCIDLKYRLRICVRRMYTSVHQGATTQAECYKFQGNLTAPCMIPIQSNHQSFATITRMIIVL